VGLRFGTKGTRWGEHQFGLITQLKAGGPWVFSLPEDNIPPLQAKLLAHQTLTAVAYDHDLGKKLAEGTLLRSTTGERQLGYIPVERPSFPTKMNRCFPTNSSSSAVGLPAQGRDRAATVVQIGPIVLLRLTSSSPNNTIEQRTVETGHVEGGWRSSRAGWPPGGAVATASTSFSRAAVTVIKPEAGPVVAKHGG